MKEKQRFVVDVLLSNGLAEYDLSIPAFDESDAIDKATLLVTHGTNLKVIDVRVQSIGKGKQPIGFDLSTKRPDVNPLNATSNLEG